MVSYLMCIPGSILLLFMTRNDCKDHASTFLTKNNTNSAKMSCRAQGIFLNLSKVCRWVPSKSRGLCGIVKPSKTFGGGFAI